MIIALHSSGCAHTLHELPDWSQAPWSRILMSFSMKALAAAALGLHCRDIIVLLYEVILWLLYGYVVAVAMTAASSRRVAELWLPCQPGEKKHACSSYGSLHLLPAS